MDEADRQRRRRNKLYNERVKLLTTLVNNSAVAIAAGAIIIPFATTGNWTASFAIWLLAVFTLHVVAQAALTLYRSED
jgi:hypothetical protein